MSYLVEQPPYCDLLKLSPSSRRFVSYERGKSPVAVSSSERRCGSLVLCLCLALAGGCRIYGDRLPIFLFFLRVVVTSGLAVKYITVGEHKEASLTQSVAWWFRQRESLGF